MGCSDAVIDDGEVDDDGDGDDDSDVGDGDGDDVGVGDGGDGDDVIVQVNEEQSVKREEQLQKQIKVRRGEDCIMYRG